MRLISPRNTEPQSEEHWIDMATADGFPWDDMPFSDVVEEATEG